MSQDSPRSRRLRKAYLGVTRTSRRACRRQPEACEQGSRGVLPEGERERRSGLTMERKSKKEPPSLLPRTSQISLPVDLGTSPGSPSNPNCRKNWDLEHSGPGACLKRVHGSPPGARRETQWKGAECSCTPIWAWRLGGITLGKYLAQTCPAAHPEMAGAAADPAQASIPAWPQRSSFPMHSAAFEILRRSGRGSSSSTGRTERLGTDLAGFDACAASVRPGRACAGSFEGPPA